MAILYCVQLNSTPLGTHEVFGPGNGGGLAMAMDLYTPELHQGFYDAMAAEVKTVIYNGYRVHKMETT